MHYERQILKTLHSIDAGLPASSRRKNASGIDVLKLKSIVL